MKLRATHWVRPARARDFARVEREAGLMLAACLPRLPSPPAGEELRDEGEAGQRYQCHPVENKFDQLDH